MAKQKKIKGLSKVQEAEEAKDDNQVNGKKLEKPKKVKKARSAKALTEQPATQPGPEELEHVGAEKQDGLAAAADSPQKPEKKKKRKKKEQELPEPSTELQAVEEVAAVVKPKQKKRKKARAAVAVEAEQPAALTDALEPPPEAGAALSLDAAGEQATEPEADAGKRNGGTAAKAFQRVKAEDWLGKHAARDNSYAATFGASGWGAKAEAVLGQVRGKDFRHEKTKKKRGTYRGGAISHTVNSFKFESDDE